MPPTLARSASEPAMSERDNSNLVLASASHCTRTIEEKSSKRHRRSLGGLTLIYDQLRYGLGVHGMHWHPPEVTDHKATYQIQKPRKGLAFNDWIKMIRAKLLNVKRLHFILFTTLTDFHKVTNQEVIC